MSELNERLSYRATELALGKRAKHPSSHDIRLLEAAHDEIVVALVLAELEVKGESSATSFSTQNKYDARRHVSDR